MPACVLRSYARCMREHDRNPVAIGSSLFPRQWQAPYHPHTLDNDPRAGFPLTPSLGRARADPACDSSRLCVMAVFSCRFTTTHRSSHSHERQRERSPHLKESFPVVEQAECRQPWAQPLVYCLCVISHNDKLLQAYLRFSYWLMVL